MFEIGSQAKPNARMIASQLGLDEGYISRVIKGLEASDMIGRTPSPSDRRVNQLVLTRSGAQVYARLVETAEAAVRDMVSGLPDATLGQLLASMSTVKGILSWPNVAEPRIRDLRSGDIGWIIKRHGEIYSAEEAFDMTFEALVAKIVAEFMQDRRQPMENGWVAESDSLRLGCVFVVADDQRIARLRLMLVEPFARGKGVGQLLIDTALQHARKNGFEKMVLWTQLGLEAACRLYQRNGFQVIDSQPGEIFGRDVINQSWEREL
ncbi:MAG: GNAT family N-acetyltransferase [Alphaproteobacteria bacterium]|nr:GNAT family N-acetyltransferase [Alphaproteobacteria bacterium]